MITNGKAIAAVHPDHGERDKVLKFMRISFAGEDEVKRNAIVADFIRVPAGMTGYANERSPVYHNVEAMKEAHDYVERARYPDVVPHALAMAVGKAWSREPEIKGDSVKPILESVFANGDDFRSGVLAVLEDYILTGGGGLFVNLNSKGQAVIYHYAPENVVNWNHGDEGLRLVVFETETAGADPFLHETDTKRYVAGIDADTGKYFQERWTFHLVGEGKGAKHEWTLETTERIYPTMQQNSMTAIPFVAIGGWELKPIFKALAKSAKAYFRHSAEYAHAMFWSAMPQPVITFKENGDFYGVDDFDPANAGGADNAGEVAPPTMKMGSTTPILLRDAEFKFVSAPNGSLSALKERLMNDREEIGGLGLRAFNNSTNANQTAETERLQQSGEGSMIHSAYREVAMAITRAVRLVAQWRGIKDADQFSFEFNKSILFDEFDMSDIGGLQMLHSEGYLTRRHVRDALRKKGIIAAHETNEDLDEEIAGELGLGGGFGDGADDELSDEDILGAGVTDSDEDDE